MTATVRNTEDVQALGSDARRAGRDIPVLMAGDWPGSGAGNAVSSDVLLAALERLATVDLLVHRISLRPSLRAEPAAARHRVFSIGTQPAVVHGEGMAAGWLHRDRFAQWSCAWAVTSRYASALYASRVPYVVWEATTARDELDSISIKHVRRNGNGSGFGAALHRLLSPLDERLERGVYLRAARLLAMGEYSRSLIVSDHGIPAERVEVLLSPPSLAFLDALGQRTRANSPPPSCEAPRLLFVGRITDPRKNADLLLDSFRRLRERMPNATLTIVGRHTPQWRDRSGADRPGSGISLTGEVDTPALAEAYLAHDLLLVTSRQEGYGLVVAEALHAGLPVVSTKCGGPEAIIRESDGGVLVDHTAGDIACAADALLSNEAQWLSRARNGSAYAHNMLSFERFVSRVSDVTRSVAWDKAKTPRDM
jgi:glycosyltransferase involved in cell wall biosynthesis